MTNNPAGSPPFVIKDVRLFDGEFVTPRTSVAVRDGLIEAVAPAIAMAGAELIEGRGRTLLPGLTDCHVHAWGPLDRVLQRNLLFGVTTVLEMMCDGDGLDEVREAKRLDAPDQAQILSSGFAVTVAGAHGTEYGFPVPTVEGVVDAQAFVDARIAEGSDYVKVIYNDPLLPGMLSRVLLEASVEAAHARDKLAVVHINTQKSASEAIAAGADGLAHLFLGPSDPEFGEHVAAASAFVVPTLTVLESSERPGGTSLLGDARVAPFLTSYDRRQLALDAATRRAERGLPARQRPAGWAFENTARTIAQLRAATVPILAGTDTPNPGVTHGASIHRELELLVNAGLTPIEALAAATSVPASCFGMHDRGRIAPGLRADLLLVEGDATVDITQTRAIAGVWKAGVQLARLPAG